MTEDGNIRTKVSVKREQNFTRSGQEEADEVNQIIYVIPCMFEVANFRLKYSEEMRILSL